MSPPAEAPAPRDLVGGMDRLPQEEWHRLRRALPWVAISFAPYGAVKGCRGVLHPYAMGYDLTPASRAFSISSLYVNAYGASAPPPDAGGI